MRAKEYLSQIELLQVKIDQKRQRARECREMVLSSGGFDYSRERVQTSASGGQIEDQVIRFLELEAEINESLIVLEQRKEQIVGEIHNMSNANHIKILYKRYVECKNLTQVAYEMQYSYDRIRHMHGTALKEFEKMKVSTQ